MQAQEKISTQQSQELINSWDLQLKALDEKLRVSGRTVTVETEPLDGDELVATVPQGKKPKSSQTKPMTMDSVEFLEKVDQALLDSLGNSPIPNVPPSWPSQEVMEARLDNAIEQFKKDTAGKSWEDLANDLEAKNRPTHGR